MRLAVVVLILFAVSAHAADPAYDLIIRNGRVVDGTGNPWFHADVAIRGDKIVAIGNKAFRSSEARDRCQGSRRRARFHRHALALGHAFARGWQRSE
jgi:hypothetical protein